MSSGFPVDCLDSLNESNGGSANARIGNARTTRFDSPLAAALWIVVASFVGVLVFEMTSLGEQRSRHWIVQPTAHGDFLTVQSDTSSARSGTARH